MKFSKFFVFVGVLFVVALVVYFTTTPSGNEIRPDGDRYTGNDVIDQPPTRGAYGPSHGG